MKIAIIRPGRVGLVFGSSPADVGHTPPCIGKDASKISRSASRADAARFPEHLSQGRRSQFHLCRDRLWVVGVFFLGHRVGTGYVRLIVSKSPWRKRGAGRSSGLTARSFRGRSMLPQTDRGGIAEVPNYVRLTRIRAVLEIVPGPDGRPPENLLWNAYRASQSGVIVFALNGVTVASVNKVMDGIVPHFPLNIPGVLYIDAQDRCLLTWVLNRAKMIFWQTNAFQRVARRSMNCQRRTFRGLFASLGDRCD